MGINVILPLIIGIGLMLSLGTNIAPSIIEDMKIAKIENKTIENQEIIKNAIIRYIQIEDKAPIDMNDLKNSNLLKDYHNDNLFNQGYTFEINSKKGYIKIKTKIDDNGAIKYFENNIKYPNKPNCITMINNICQNNEFETIYLVDNDIHDILLKNAKVEYTDPEYLDKFVEENIGKKDEHLKNPPKDGDKDYVIKGPDKIIEYVYDEESDTWFKEPEKTVGGIGANTGVEIKLVDVPYHIWNEETNELELTSKKHEKVVCNATSINKEVFVVNQITGLGEIVWVAPSTNSVSAIQTKIFGGTSQSILENATNIVGNGVNDLKYISNNICISNLINISSMFLYAEAFNQALNRWDTSNIVRMWGMFIYANNFNQDISSWDVSNVRDTSSMFRDAKAFNNSEQPLDWDVSNVTSMLEMFEDAIEFNQTLNWNVSKVTNMGEMFYGASSFNQPLNFNISNVIYMSSMFKDAKSFNQTLNWNVSKVTNMEWMFLNAEYFNGDISKWDVSNVTDMHGMFYGAENFNSDIGDWDVSKVTFMDFMFYKAKKFNQDISNWNVSNVKDMLNMFANANTFNQPIGNWNTSNVRDMSSMFANATSFNQTLNWNVSKVIRMSGMFYEAKAFNQDLSKWCVFEIKTKPTSFDTSTPAWIKPKPKWGVPCP